MIDQGAFTMIVVVTGLLLIALALIAWEKTRAHRGTPRGNDDRGSMAFADGGYHADAGCDAHAADGGGCDGGGDGGGD